MTFTHPEGRWAEPIAPHSTENGRPADMPWLSPYLTVRDARSALRFYEAAFGFAPKETKVGPDGSILHAAMTWRDAVILFGPEGAHGDDTRSPATSGVRPPVTLYVYCDDVDAFHARATAHGAKTAFAPMDAMWGDRLCKLIDPDGHAWNFATCKG